MYIFTCEDRFEDMMCCIYQAWEKALKVGHGCVRLEKRGEEQPSLFDEYVHVEYDEEEYKKVVRSIKKKISNEAYACVYYACLSYGEGLCMKSDILQNLQDLILFRERYTYVILNLRVM